MSWFKIPLSAAQVGDGVEMKILDLFSEAFMSAKGPPDMALFTVKLGLGGVELFFSPGSIPHALVIIAQYGGQECDKPAKESVVLLSGHADAKDKLL